ncbi:hypothetical protein H0H87_000714 [Tephrocybe sp. NHM501043]|nr:hypothetical protein H0H87_000714 [Tephrocybe sp. NHM501043]
MVWDETVKIMDSLFDDVWGDRDVIVTDHCVEVTLPIALFVIGAAGFGRTISWKDDDTIPTGRQLTFKDALHIVTTDIFLKLIVPERALGLTRRLRNVRLAFDELETTAHTLCFTFAMLALYEEEQEKLYQHIQSVLATGRLPVTGIPKYSAEDTTLTTLDADGNRESIAVPKGASITINVPGLHYNRMWLSILVYLQLVHNH